MNTIKSGILIGGAVAVGYVGFAAASIAGYRLARLVDEKVTKRWAEHKAQKKETRNKVA